MPVFRYLVAGGKGEEKTTIEWITKIVRVITVRVQSAQRFHNARIRDVRQYVTWRDKCRNEIAKWENDSLQAAEINYNGGPHKAAMQSPAIVKLAIRCTLSSGQAQNPFEMPLCIRAPV